MYIHIDRFTWDVGKSQSNLAKHGVSFEEAASIFSEVNALDWEDFSHSGVEPRRKRLGKSEAGNLLIAICTMRHDPHGKEIIRIISARKASRKERQAYAG